VDGSNLPAYAIDRDASTYFSAGGFAPQQIEIDLGGRYDLDSIRLLTKQSPAGSTTHVLYAGGDLDHMAPIGGHSGNTTSGQWLTTAVRSREIRYLQVRTIESPSWVGWAEIQVFGTPSPPSTTSAACPGLSSNPQYFGYFASSYINSQVGDVSAAYVDHGNLAWIGDACWRPAALGLDPERDIARLTAAALRGQKSVLYVRGLFLDNNFRLLADHRSYWQAYADAIRPYLADVAAFYPLDEPYSQLKKHDSTVADLTPAEMKASLETINAVIHETFPGVPTAVFFNWAELDDSFVMPSGYDWVGFDCYGPWEKCGGRPIADHYRFLRDRRLPGQRMMVIPEAALATPIDKPLPMQAQLDLITRADRYYQVAGADRDVVAVIPFIWQSLPNKERTWELRGVGELSSYVQEKFRAMGTCVTR
jgi:hypothetical protein